ncbi:magnesium transporter [Abditibacterium utsteinense]|uniref:Magnesium transport protein CorA n=1 Tax=Abditibacterium utsteinense TaxID=1960156 RepID=A0A2S8SUJ0_9BACT|nr:magnesium/cobalt transporter CorA [Abditibacterium utsteinense]PQV64454.1 magnesium transporter [Abditibacterium utsteinense]
MFRAFLYDTPTNKLEALDEKSIFNCDLHSDKNQASPLSHSPSFVWIDANEPTPDEIEALARRFKLDPQILEDIRSSEGRPKLHDYDNYIYLIFHAINLELDEDARLDLKTLEIDCLLGPDWILTIHPRIVPQFEELAKRWNRKPDWMKNGAPQLLYELMDSVLDGYFPLLDQMDEKINEFEDRLYNSASEETENGSMSGEIFVLKRTLLEIRHLAVPTRDVVNVLLRRDAQEGGRNFAAFQDLYDHASRIVENIDTYREILGGALDAYLAIESNRMNAVMKRFAAYSIILLLPTLIAGIYGMNFDDLPKAHGFWNSIGVMGVTIIASAGYFRWRKWL